jgi:hypothetical protein
MRRHAPRRPVLARLLGSLLLVAGSALMALSATGGGASALGRIAPPSVPSALGSTVCDAGSALGPPAAAVPAQRCSRDDEDTETTTSCSTTDEEEEESDSGEHGHREEPGRAAATATTTESTGPARAAARTTTTTEPAPPPASLAAGISGASSVPATGVKAAAVTVAPTRAPVTTTPVTGASAPFGLGLALGIGGLSLLGLAARRPRRQ